MTADAADSRAARVGRGCLISIAFFFAGLATSAIVWSLGSTFGSTAVCVAYDPTLLRTHRIVYTMLLVLAVLCWLLGGEAMTRTKRFRRVAAAFAIPASIVALLVASNALLNRAPAWLDVSDDASPACV